MKNNQPPYELSHEFRRLYDATTEKVNLFIQENKLSGILKDSILSISYELHDIWRQLNEAREYSKQFESASMAEQVRDYLTKSTELAVLRLSNLSNRADRCREISAKYDVPKLRCFKNLESCAEATRSFMRVWRDEADQRRAAGEKSLLERIRELGDHRGMNATTTLEEMRLSIVDIGNMVSFHLCWYFRLTSSVSGEKEALAGKIRAVEALLDCLILEENKSGSSSVIIDRFKSMVRLVKTELNVGDCGVGDVDVTALRLERKESHLVASILREVLRFEVSLNCPNLPMMLTDEVFLGMAMYMRHVFEMKLGSLSSELRVFKKRLKIGDEDPDIKNLLDFGTKKIWDELDLNDIRS